jgi:hypothetical protein
MASLEKSTLSSPWVLYEHPAGTSDWSLSSYKQITKVTTKEEVASLIRSMAMDEDHVTGSYLCFMRDGVAPVYESKENKEGGAITIRFNLEHAKSFWMMFIAHAVCEDILIPNETHTSDIIHGIIISPKRGNIIIQIWTKKTISKDDLNPILKLSIPGDIFYRPHYERL